MERKDFNEDNLTNNYLSSENDLSFLDEDFIFTLANSETDSLYLEEQKLSTETTKNQIKKKEKQPYYNMFRIKIEQPASEKVQKQKKVKVNSPVAFVVPKTVYNLKFDLIQYKEKRQAPKKQEEIPWEELNQG